MATTPITVLAVLGPIAVAGAWTIVRIRRASIWLVMGIVMGALGVLAALTGVVRLSGEIDAWVAAGLGVLAGVSLYLATAVFMAIAVRWPLLARHTEGIYDQRAGVPLPTALAVAMLVVAPGEELFWRGIVQGTLASPLGSAGAALATWAVYVGANGAGWSVPILLAAVVGGAVWGGLALLTGGVAASIACHAVWTGLMIIRPPARRRVP